MAAQSPLSDAHATKLHERIDGLSLRFADHDTRNAERFGRLEQQSKHIEKVQDQQGHKIEAIETTVNRIDGKLDAVLKPNARDRSETGTTWRTREEVKADIWMTKAKKAAIAAGIAIAAGAASIFGYKAVSAGGDKPHPAPMESTK